MTKAEENENKLISQRYAKAVLDFAKEGYSKEEIFSEISDVQHSLEKSVDLQRVMSSPVISADEKKEVISKIFGNNVNNIILKFLKLLIDKNRFNILSSIVKEIKNEINKANGLLEIKVTSAIDLSNSERAMVKIKLEKVLNKPIELDWSVDKDIIGGLVFEANDNIVDCSLRHKLQEINRNMKV